MRKLSELTKSRLICGGVLSYLLCFSSLASAQDNGISLNDLRRVLQGSESKSSQEQPIEPDQNERSESSESEVEPEETPRSITFEDLARAFGETIPAEENTSEAETEPEAIPQQTNETELEVVTAPKRNARYESPASNWVCSLSLQETGTPSDADVLTFGAPGGKHSFYFASADFSLNRDGMVSIARMSGDFKAAINAGDRLVVVGYTDAAGNPQANIILSLQRAYNVKACIVEMAGLNPSDIVVEGHGSFSVVREPAARRSLENRRVDVMLESDFLRRFEETFSALNR